MENLTPVKIDYNDQLKSIILGLVWGANKPVNCHFEKTGPFLSIVTAQAEVYLIILLTF